MRGACLVARTRSRRGLRTLCVESAKFASGAQSARKTTSECHRPNLDAIAARPNLNSIYFCAPMRPPALMALKKDVCFLFVFAFFRESRSRAASRDG